MNLKNRNIIHIYSNSQTTLNIRNNLKEGKIILFNIIILLFFFFNFFFFNFIIITLI